MTIPNNKFINGLHTHQIAVLKALDSRKARFADLEWHRKSRKTTLAINYLIREACRFPSTVWDYVAPTYRQARSIVWDDPNMLSAYLPDQNEMGWVRNEQKLHIKFNNSAIIRILGADNVDSLRGPDCEGVVFDEWALIDPQAWTAIYRPIITLKPYRVALFLWTPVGINHATDEQSKRLQWPEWYCETLRASESGLVDSRVLEQAQKEMPKTLYDQEYECAHVTDEEMTLITSKMLELLKSSHYSKFEKRRLIAIDPALGGDKCAAKAMENRRVLEHASFYDRDATKLVAQIQVMANKWAMTDIVLDSCGLGKPIGDMLAALNFKVVFLNSSESAVDSRFANKKAEMWWYAMEEVQAGRAVYPEDIDTVQQIPHASRYKISKGRIAMLEKAEVKKNIGHSPDDAECWVYGIYGEKFVMPSNTATSGISLIPDFIGNG